MSPNMIYIENDSDREGCSPRSGDSTHMCVDWQFIESLGYGVKWRSHVLGHL